MLGWFTDKSTYRQWVWLCAPSYEHKTIWRLEKWGKGAVKFTVLLMWQILDVILWFNISLIWPAWTKTTHPLQLGNLLWMMKRNPLEKKNPGLKYSSWEKSHCNTPKHCHTELHKNITWNLFSCTPSRTTVPRHAQLEEKVHNKTWAYLQSIMKYIFKYKS